YKGFAFKKFIKHFDQNYTEPLGVQQNHRLNYIRFKAETGNVFIHTQPLCFTNYFMLTGNNYRYTQNALSVLDNHYDEVIWDEYYQVSRLAPEDSGNKSTWGFLFSIPAFK